jgi:flagellar basal body P-ring formation protein FlgA
MAHIKTLSAACISITMLPHMAIAQQTADPLAQIEGQIAEFTGALLGTPGGLARPLDRRIRLSPCATPPQLRMGPMLDHIIISCGQAGWRFTAPLAPLPGTSVQATVGGAPIRSFAKAEPIIRKGDSINLIVPGNGFAIESRAIAEEDGSEGATIRVRTAAKGPVLRARVISADRVSLP